MLCRIQNRSMPAPGKMDQFRGMRKLKKEIGIPMSIKEAGVDEKVFMDGLDALSELAFDDQCTGANPRYPLISEMKEIYLKAYRGEI